MSFVVFVEFCATNWWNSVADSVHRARAEINRIATEILYTHASRFPFFFFFVFPSFYFSFSFFSRKKKLTIKSLDITRSRPNIETRFFFLFFFLMETDRDDF